MFRHVLAAVDGSDASLKAQQIALDLAGRFGAELAVVSVSEEPPAYRSDQQQLAAEVAASKQYYGELHRQAEAEASRRGIPFSSAMLDGHEVQALLGYARDHGVDLLVLGARGHSGVWGAFLGSTADKVVGHAPASVLVVRPEEAGLSFKEIVVALDGSPFGERALHEALELARLRGAALRAVSVVEDATSGRRASGAAEDTYLRSVLARAEAQAESAGVPLNSVIRHGEAARAIAGYATDTDADLIVLGSTGHGQPWSSTAGGTARRVANEARQAVLVIRPVAPRTVADVMVRHVTAVGPETPLPDIVERLVRQRVRALPVVSTERQLLGIITGGDLLERAGLGMRLSLHGAFSAEDLAVLSGGSPQPLTAAEVMTAQPRTIRSDASIDEAIHLLVSARIKRLPVVDDGGALAGIVSRTDILRAVSAAGVAESPPANPEGRQAQTVAGVMDTQAPTVAPDAPAEQVLETVLQSPYRRVAVVDAEGRVTGIISDRRLLAHADARSRPGLLARLAGLAGLGHGIDHLPLTAERLTEGTVYSVAPQASLQEAAREFTARRVKRLVVMDEQGRYQGILDRRALLASLMTAG